MLKGKTSTGFEFKIPKATLDNYELVEAIGDLETNPLAIIQVINMLLGEEQKNALKEHVRDEDGVVTTSVLTNEITEIFNSQQEIKK